MSNFSNFIVLKLKISHLGFTLRAKGQGLKALIMPTWQYFLRVLAPRVRPLEESLRWTRIKTQTITEGPTSSSWKYSNNCQFNILKFFYDPKTWPLDMFGHQQSSAHALCVKGPQSWHQTITYTIFSKALDSSDGY